MDATLPWATWVALIDPFYYSGKKGPKPKPLDTMLRMYLLQVWFSLSDEGVEEAIYDSYAMRMFMGLDFALEQVPDATTFAGLSPSAGAPRDRRATVRGAERPLRRRAG